MSGADDGDIAATVRDAVQRRASRTASDDAVHQRTRDTLVLRVQEPLVRLAARVGAMLGADRLQCEAILLTRVRLDARSGGIKTGQSASLGMFFTLVMFGMIGVFAGGFVALGSASNLIAMSAVQAGLILVIGMLMAGDYLSMLTDPAETVVVAPCPVSGRTVLVARALHLVVYLALPVFAYSLPPWLAGLARDDTVIWMLAMPFISALALCLAVTSLLIAFVVMLQRLDPERLRTVLLQLQIAASLVVFGGYYAFAGLLGNEAVRAWLGGEHFGLLAVPPFWFGGLYELLGGRVSALNIALGAFAVLITMASLVMLLGTAGPRLVTGLASLASGGGSTKARPVRRGPLRRFVERFVHDGAEQAGFDTLLALSTRERGFRSRVYPMLVLPIVFLIAMGTQGNNSQTMLMLMWGTFIPALYGLNILIQVRFSDTPDAAWLFAATPLEQPGVFVAGVIKALALVYVLPWLLLVMGLAAALTGQIPVVDMAFGAAIALVLMLAFALRSGHEVFPFSRTFTAKDNRQTGLMMFGMLAVFGMAGAHYGLKQLPFGRELATLVMLPLLAWQLRRLRGLRLDHDALRVR